MASNNDDVIGRTDENAEDGTVVQNSPIADMIGSDSGGGSGQSGEQEPNTRFVTNILYENNGSVYGFEILLFDIDNNQIETIMVVDETDFDSWTEMISKLKDVYVPYSEQDALNLESLKSEKAKIGKKGYKTNAEEIYTLEDYEDFINNLEWSDLKDMGSLESILKNELNTTINNYPVEINATKFMGMDSDKFSKVGHSHNFAEKSHSARDNSYGVGDEELYGHVKVINNLNKVMYVAGESLSAYQGKVLNDSIKSIKDNTAWSKVQAIDTYLSYKVNAGLRLVVCNFNRNDYTGLKDKTGNQLLYKKGTIPDKYAPSSRVSTPMYRGDVVLYYNRDGSVNLYNLTKIKKMNLHAQVMWHY